MSATYKCDICFQPTDEDPPSQIFLGYKRKDVCASCFVLVVQAIDALIKRLANPLELIPIAKTNLEIERRRPKRGPFIRTLEALEIPHRVLTAIADPGSSID